MLGYAYFTPEARYLQPTFIADRKWLHLEARYNYEDFETGSAWVGANFAGGGDVRWKITPIAGAVFGRTAGVAPGYRGSLAVWKLELQSEGEYLFDLDDESSSFFYSWSELAFLPREFVRLGVVAQRTQAYQTQRDLQRGLLLGFTAPKLSATAYMFNPDDAEPTFVVGVEIEF